MSYEGHHQCICENGHYETQPENYSSNLDPCHYCGAKIAWSNPVDDTNCDSVGYIPHEVLDAQFLSQPQETETCNMGHEHVKREAIYRIPTREETDPLRTMQTENGVELCSTVRARYMQHR